MDGRRLSYKAVMRASLKVFEALQTTEFRATGLFLLEMMILFVDSAANSLNLHKMCPSSVSAVQFPTWTLPSRALSR